MRALVVHWGRNGGGPRFAADAVEGLRRAGVWTAYSYSAQSERAAMDEGAADADVPVDTFGSGIGSVARSYRAVRGARRLRDFALANEIDVVFAAMEQIWQPAVARAFRRTGIPYLLGIHDAAFHPGESSMVRAATRRLELRAADGLVTFSSSVDDAIRGSWSFPSERVWSTFLPARVTAATAHPSSDGLLRVGFFGRWKAYKGLPLLVAAARILERDAVPCIITIHGDGEEPVLSSAELPRNIEVHRGWVAEREVEQIVAGFDVLVAPYEESSQSGVVPLAAALGIPSVVTPVGGLREQVVDGSTGIVVQGVDADSIAAGIRRLVEDEALRTALGATARDAAEGQRPVARFGEEMLEIAEAMRRAGKRA